MEWKDVLSMVLHLDADSTNPRPTTKALKALTVYFDDYQKGIDNQLNHIAEKIRTLEKIKK